MSDPLASRPLFGGAISLDLPNHYIDASNLRQIPDNQEVFLSSNSDTAIVLEVLGMVEDGLASTDLWEAVKFHFSSIAHDNASLESTILTPPPPTPVPSSSSTMEGATTPEPITLSGIQKIHKFSHNPSGAPRAGHETDTPDEVWIGLALWRIYLEDPVQKRRKKADLVLSVNVNLSSNDGKEEQKKVEDWFFGKSVGSLKVLDFGLFGDE